MLVQILALENRYSLVGYPVGYHVDVFNEGNHSLESKICLSMDVIPVCNIGRGAGGESKFVFALLDWRNSSGSSTRLNQYVAAGGILTHGSRLS